MFGSIDLVILFIITTLIIFPIAFYIGKTKGKKEAFKDFRIKELEEKLRIAMQILLKYLTRN